MDKYDFFEEGDLLLGQLNAGDYFWLDGEVWEVCKPGQNRMTTCSRLGKGEQVNMPSNTIVQATDR